MKKTTSKFRKFIVPIVVTLLLVVAAAWKLGNNKEKMAQNASIANQKVTVFPVTVVHPSSEIISQNFESIGTFNAAHELNFQSEVSGKVLAVMVKNGDYVNKGQVIAQLDNEQINIDLQLANATLDKVKNDLEKYETMLQGNAVNKQQVEEAKLSVKNAESRVATLKRQLRTSTITSPIAGNINSFSIEVGSYLSPGTKIAEIVEVNTLKMTVQLLDNEVMRISKGQNISLVPDLYPSVNLSGKVVSIASKADGARRYGVEIETPNNTQHPLKAGMTGKAVFEFGGTKKATTIPLRSIVGSIKDPKVFVVNGKTAQLKKITIGSVLEGKVEVLGGLDSTEQVVTSGQLNIVNGSKIQVVQ